MKNALSPLAPIALAGTLVVALAACGSPPMGGNAAAQAAVPAPVQVPAGHRVAWETVGVGEITYECRTNASGVHEWTFVGPKAMLNDRTGKTVGRYEGPPATWTAADGSALTGAQLATAPGGSGNIPLQLVKANPATGRGMLEGVTHIQRLATQGGSAPAASCAASNSGARQNVGYRADYIFWKAA